MDYAKEGIDMVSGMDENEVISICILVVKEDVACNNIVARMLHGCKHRVLCTGGVLDVLHAIWEKKDGLDIVLTNADRLELSGPEIIKHIDKTLHLRVMSISIDKRKLESRGQPFTFEAFIINGSSLNDVNKLCLTALGRERGKMVAARQEENVKRASISNVSVEINKTSSPIMDTTHSNQKRKAVDTSEGSAEDHPTTKKRVTWTPERHKKFEEAIEFLGVENAVPKKIVEVMNDPELTRENVASHLQKHRLGLKRAQEISSHSGMNASNNFQGVSVLSSSFGSNFERSLLFSDRNGPKVHIAPNFGIYEDQKRNMLLSIDSNVPSSKFVGIRVTNDGKCVGYGNAEEASNTVETESFVSTSFPGQKIGDEYPFNLDLSAPQSFSLGSFGDCGNEEDTEKSRPLGDQDTNMQSWEAPTTVVPFPVPSEMDISVQNESAMLHHEQDFSIPMEMTPWSVLPSMVVSEEHHSQSPLPQNGEHFDLLGCDGALREEGTGSTSNPYDLGEFDWCHD